MNMRRIRMLTLVAALTVAALVVAVPTFAGEDDRGTTVREEIRDLAVQQTDAGTARSTQAAREPQAARGCWDDPQGDPDPGPYPKADLVRWCAGMTTDMVSLSHRNASPTNPASDPNWINGITGLLWSVDLHGDTDPEFHVFLVNDGDRVRVEVTDTDLNPRCAGAHTFDGTTYEATFATSCIGKPDKIWVDAFMAYDSQWDDPYAPVYGDASAYGGPIQAASPSQPPPPAAPAGDVELGRLAGGDRYATAVRISQYGFPNGASEVYLARADDFPDALAGGALTGGPVLLVPSCGQVPANVIEEARRLQPAKVIALGGTAAICDDVLDAFAGS